MVAAAIIGAVLAIVTSLTSAGAQMAAAKEEKKIGKMQAEGAERQAEFAREAAAIKEKQHKQAIRALLAKQRAEIGASGFLSSGSPLEVYQFSKEQGEQDLELIRKQGELEVGGWETQAKIYSRSANTAYKMAKVGAALEILGGIGKAVGGFGGLSGGGGGSVNIPRTSTPASTASPTPSSSGYVNYSGFYYPMMRYKTYAWGS